jgi:rod shape determining protein RodA
LNVLAPLARLGRDKPAVIVKIVGLRWDLALLIAALAGIGIAALYSAADGHMQPWAGKQLTRFASALGPMIAAALLGVRRWFRIAYWTYGATLLLIVAVDLRGFVGMGAQRWIDLGLIQLQPSQLMSIALVLSLGRYFHSLRDENTGKLRYLIVPVLVIGLPTALILKEPDLGTALVLLMTGIIVMFIAGVRLPVFGAGVLVVGLSLPLAWRFLRDYQKIRIYTFLNPDNDRLGAGYHILQSKIALGSGGLFGKGFLLGTQSHLSFLPEKQTDFIFTTLAEEFGLVGGLGLLALYALILAYGFAIALRSRNHFGRLVCLGIVANFFLYVFINIAMVTGLIPVVGVPLPLISYGGTAMLTMMFGVGLMMSVYLDRDVRLNRAGEAPSDQAGRFGDF